MKKPYLTQEERIMIKTDTWIGACMKLDLEVRKLERQYYRDYWIFGYFIFRIKMYEVLIPFNKIIKENWYKSNGRSCL